MAKRRGRNPKIPRSTQVRVFLDVASSSLSYSEIGKKYGVTGSYVSYLYHRWKNQPPVEIATHLQMKENEEPDKDAVDSSVRLAELEQQLAYAQLKIEALEKMIDLAEETFEIDIRKKPGSQQQDT